MQDSNNLLSTIIQSSAAIVAILGGFLASKLISLTEEERKASRHFHVLTLEQLSLDDQPDSRAKTKRLEEIKQELADITWDSEERQQDIRIRFALVPIALLTIAGIVAPLIVMAAGATGISVLTRVLLVGGFLVGLGVTAFFTYGLVAMRRED